jgi:hypothetical protein
MQGTVRSVTPAVDDDGWFVAVRWDDGTLSEDRSDTAPLVGDRIERSE